jgi:AraC family transcriptional regulator of adaptative response / DNA-3-methyladenine glycosylase II
VRTSLELPPDFDREFFLAFIGARAVPGLEAVEAGTLRRGVRADAGTGSEDFVLTLALGPARLTVTCSSPAPPARLRVLAGRLLGLGPDLAPFHRLAARDPLLRRLVAARPGLRVPQFLDPFEGAVRAILGQQVSVAGARTIAGRLVAALGQPVAGESLRAFPSPAVVAAAGASRLAGLGLTGAKAWSLAGLAAAAQAGALDWERLRHLPGPEAEAELASLPGIGPWTAAYIRMRALGDLDALPASDLGLLKALAGNGERPDLATVQARAERWRPYRALAVIHLWNAPAAGVRHRPGTKKAAQA